MYELFEKIFCITAIAQHQWNIHAPTLVMIKSDVKPTPAGPYTQDFSCGGPFPPLPLPFPLPTDALANEAADSNRHAQ